ncbi:MAG: hypothetical protein AVO38_13995 [delta proteobacterium ML8_D]|jgi:PAS domain S-box-containing protein|nr:MAG: hypothetical protein AVO38_13995 [delta proteobacterium ML8_D]
MKPKILELIDFEKVNNLLEGFSKTTGFVTAILDLEGNVLSRSGWRQICTDFHRANPETAKKCKISDTVLAGKMAEGEKYHSYQCLNGLVDVAVPIVIKGEHIANLFTGQFFFKEPDKSFFKKQAEKYGFAEKKYLQALNKVPVVSEENVKVAIDFLLNMTLLISELTYRKIEQTALNNELEEKEDKLSKIMMATNDGMWDWDLKTNQVYFDPRYYQLAGYDVDEFPHHLDEFQKRVHPADVDYVMNEAEKHLKGEIDRFNVKFRFRKKSGDWQWIQGKGIIVERDEKGVPQRFVGTHRDISELKQVEEVLRSNFALLQIAGKTAKFGGWCVDLENNVCTWSDAVADIHEVPHGYAPKVEEGINFYAHEWHDKITKIFNDCAQKGIPYDQEMEIITSKGKRVWVRTIGRAVKDEKGRIIKVQGSFQDITERKQAEEALRQREESQRLLAKNTLDVIWVMTMDARFTYVNPAIEMMFGFSPDEWIGSGLWEHCDALHCAKMRALIEKETARGPGQPGVIFETQMLRRDGSPIAVEIHGQIIFDDQGAPVSVQGVTRDITERKQAQEALSRIEWMLSKKTATVKGNLSPFYGDLSELNTSRLILDAVGKNVLKDIANDFLRLLESSSAVYEKNGDYAHGIFASNWCRFMDQASRKLCGTDDNKEALNCGKWLCHDSCWKEASQPAIESGRPVDIECQGGIHLYALPIIAGDEVIGAINFGYGDPPQDKEKLSELAEKYKVPLDELIKNAKDYESRPPYIIETAKERLQASANLIGEIVSRKTTEKKILKLNEELEQRVIERTAQLEASNRELEAFSYSVSHDLRAPLRHINGYVALLNEKFHADLPEKAQYYLTTVTDAARQMGTLIDDLLQFSRAGRQELLKAKIEMNAMVEEVLETIKQDTEEREITWKVQELPQAFGDYSLLKLVWANLLDNAVKFSRNKKPAEISIGFIEEKKNFVFFVRDNGVGFNMKYAHKLFGVFQRLHSRTEFEGTGIGLANVHRIIHKHNGRVWAEAEPAKGAVFYFSLPKSSKC